MDARGAGEDAVVGAVAEAAESSVDGEGERVAVCSRVKVGMA